MVLTVTEPKNAWNGIYGDAKELRRLNSEYQPLMDKLQANLKQENYLSALKTLSELKANRSEVESHEAQLFPKSKVDTGSRFQTALAPEDMLTSAGMHLMIMDAVRDQQYKTAADLILTLVAKQASKPLEVETAFNSLISEVKNLLRDSKYGEALGKFELLDSLNLARSFDAKFKCMLFKHIDTLRDLWNPKPETVAKNQALYALDNGDLINARKWIEVAQTQQLLEVKMNTFHKDVHKLCEIVDCIESKQENKLNVDTLKTLRDSYKKLEPLFKVILENKLMDFLTEQFTTEEINKISKAAYLSYAYDAVMQNEPAKCGAYLIQYYNLRGTKANSSMN